MPYCKFRVHRSLSAAAVVICLSCSLANAEFPKFEYHPIDRIGNQMGQTSLVDIDKDGDQDIVEAEADTVDARTFWFENKGGAKSASGRLAPDWIGHLISADHTEQDFHSLALADFDNDGDIDICSKPWNGDEHVYLRNMLKENASK